MTLAAKLFIWACIVTLVLCIIGILNLTGVTDVSMPALPQVIIILYQ